MSEHLVKEYKSIQSIRTGAKGFRELAKDCVCLANAQEGEIYIGFENRTQQPPPHQGNQSRRNQQNRKKERAYCILYQFYAHVYYDIRKSFNHGIKKCLKKKITGNMI